MRWHNYRLGWPTRFGLHWQASKARRHLCSAELCLRKNATNFLTLSRRKPGDLIAYSRAFSILPGPEIPICSGSRSVKFWTLSFFWFGMRVTRAGLSCESRSSRHAGDTSRLELRKQIEPDLPMLECDPEQLKQVLLNLVMNANQAMPHGGTVLLEAQRDGANISIDVHDQGSGIDEDNLDRIFDPFFTTKENGTGLGLSVALQIASQHRGMLTIVRNSPHGVTVRLSLPLQSGQI